MRFSSIARKGAERRSLCFQPLISRSLSTALNLL